eukprot:jgi/Bigna1/84104/fgenesh1_pg.123_\
MEAGKILALLAAAAMAIELRNPLSTALTVVALAPKLLQSCEASSPVSPTNSPTALPIAGRIHNFERISGEGVADSGVTKTLLIILCVLVGTFLASFLVAIFYLLYKRRIRRRNATIDDGMGRFQSLHLSESDITRGKGSNNPTFNGGYAHGGSIEEEDDTRVVQMAQEHSASLEGGRGNKWWRRGNKKNNGGSHARQQRRGSSSGILLSTIPEEDSNDFDLVLDEAGDGENGNGGGQDDPIIIVSGVDGEAQTIMAMDDSGAVVVDGEPIRERISS